MLVNPQVATPDQATASLQHTLAAGFECSGIGLHTGVPVQVRVLPAPEHQGRVFVRVDLPNAPTLAARVEQVNQTTLSTELVQGNAHVRTVEHLLAALAVLGVDNARIEIDGPEVPLLDGSAKEWIDAIAQSGLITQTALRPGLRSLHEPIWVRQGDAFVAALPSPELRFTYGIDFDLEAIGNQWFSWAPGSTMAAGSSSFAQEVGIARTFGLAHQIEALRSQGLIKGGSLENALVCSAEGWVNPPLRFVDEPVRHKLLDLLGDLSLMGFWPQAHIVAYKASHHLHVQLARSLVQGTS